MDRLGLIETFVRALDEGSLSAAGQARGMSQSAASQQIQQLEAQMGKQLLHRSPQGVSATRAGVLVREHAQHLLERYELMLAELEALDWAAMGLCLSEFPDFGEAPSGCPPAAAEDADGAFGSFLSSLLDDCDDGVKGAVVPL